jgi:hypothetical protein
MPEAEESDEANAKILAYKFKTISVCSTRIDKLLGEELDKLLDIIHDAIAELIDTKKCLAGSFRLVIAPHATIEGTLNVSLFYINTGSNA